MSDNTNNQTDVRPSVIVKALEDAAERFGKENWSIFEIFTLAIKLVEMAVTHARDHKYPYPKRMDVKSEDGTQIGFTVRKNVDPMAVLKNHLQH